MDRDSALEGQVEHTLAEIAGLERALGDGELVVAGSTGQPKGNPLLAELRAHRLLLLRLLGVFTGDGAGPVEDELDQMRRDWEAGRGA